MVVFTADVFLMCSFAVQGLCVGAVVGCVSVWARVSVCGWVVYISAVCFIPPLLTSSADSLQSDDAILSQKVYGELVILVSQWKNVSAKNFPSNADHPRHLILLRKYISRRAAGKGRAVLEGVGLDAPTIAACFSAHPQKEEGAVQEGLIKWCGGSNGFQPPTWGVLAEAIEFAELAQQDIDSLNSALNRPAGNGTCASGDCDCAVRW